MSRIEARFQLRRDEGRKTLVCFITAGDPSAGATLATMHVLVEAGADIIELGVPFSDPMADGPVIQRASERALGNGASLAGVLDIVRRFRERNTDTPVVLMGYLNPFEAMGYTAFAESAASAGADGVITVDLPPEEAEEFVAALRGRGLDPIFLLAPNSSVERITQICAMASGFVYYVSLKGVTGAGHLDVDAVRAKVSEIKSLSGLPVGVGFGIRDAESAARISAVGDAVVVGSALVERIEKHGAEGEALARDLAALVNGMRSAMDATAAAQTDA